MAIYHCSISVYSRGKGETATGAACYRAGLAMTDERTGIEHNYTKRKGVEHFEIVVPTGSPEWAKNPSQLWNQVEKSEKRKDASLARDFEISLPHELNPEQREKLAVEITEKLVSKFGFAAMYAIHSPDGKEDNRNHHVHILTSDRKLETTGFTGKVKELNMFTGGKESTLWVREMVANTINEHLRGAGIQETVSHKSLIDQQADAADRGDLKQAILLNREPTQHIGKNPMFIAENKETNNAIKLTNQATMKTLIGNLENAISFDKKKDTTTMQSQQVSKPLPWNEPVTQSAGPAPSMGGASNIEGLIGQIKNLEHELTKLPRSFMVNILTQRARIEAQISGLKKQLAQEQAAKDRAKGGMGASSRMQPTHSPPAPDPVPIFRIEPPKLEPPRPRKLRM